MLNTQWVTESLMTHSVITTPARVYCMCMLIWGRGEGGRGRVAGQTKRELLAEVTRTVQL